MSTMRRWGLLVGAIALALGCHGNSDGAGTYQGRATWTYTPFPAGTPVTIENDIVVTTSRGDDPRVVILGCTVATWARSTAPNIVSDSGQTPVPDCKVEIPGRGSVRLTNIGLTLTRPRSYGSAKLELRAQDIPHAIKPNFILTFDGMRAP
jgi:hypothetical protein